MVDQKTFRVSTSYNRPVFEETFARTVCVSSRDAHGAVFANRNFEIGQRSSERLSLAFQRYHSPTTERRKVHIPDIYYSPFVLIKRGVGSCICDVMHLRLRI